MLVCRPERRDEGVRRMMLWRGVLRRPVHVTCDSLILVCSGYQRIVIILLSKLVPFGTFLGLLGEPLTWISLKLTTNNGNYTYMERFTIFTDLLFGSNGEFIKSISIIWLEYLRYLNSIEFIELPPVSLKTSFKVEIYLLYQYVTFDLNSLTLRLPCLRKF